MKCLEIQWIPSIVMTFLTSKLVNLSIIKVSIHFKIWQKMCFWDIKSCIGVFDNNKYVMLKRLLVNESRHLLLVYSFILSNKMRKFSIYDSKCSQACFDASNAVNEYIKYAFVNKATCYQNNPELFLGKLNWFESLNGIFYRRRRFLLNVS